MSFRPISTFGILAALVFATPPAVAAEVSFPYQAVVITDDAVVRGGNAAKFYATNLLARDTQVIVHRHDEGGWRMISPPEDAFSLVPVSRIQKLDKHTARIFASDVYTRIGSHLQKGIGVEQIPLPIGTRLELLPNHPAPPGWIAIRPPRGEYRWMREEDLKPVEPPQTTAIEQSDTDAEIETPTPDPMSEFDSLAELDIRMKELDEIPPAQWPLEALAFGYLRLKRFHLDQTERIETALARIAHLRPIRDRHLGLSTPDEHEPTFPIPPAKEPAPKLAMDEIVAAEPPAITAYRLSTDPEEYYPTNIGTMPTTTRKEKKQGPPLAKTTPAENRAMPALTPSKVSPDNAGEPRPSDPPQLQRFDAVGFLQRAIDAPAGAPAYVLISRQGEIVAYLQIPASASIAAYVGLPVGIDGQPKQVTNVALPIISADRLTPVRFASSVP